MRPKIIAGNWKMYTTPTEGLQLANELINELQDVNIGNNKVIIIPPFLHIQSIATRLAGSATISVGAQNCHFEKEGAYTGEISPGMIKDAGAEYVIIGHSERRQYFHEENAMLAKKVYAVLNEGLTPIYCCGETLEERESGKHFEVISIQINEGLFDLAPDLISKVILAYEPVWAIGTGRTASPEQAQTMHKHIRNLFSGQYGDTIADHICILYGGSVKPNNAAELFSQQDIDGGLVGGASLKAVDFVGIIKAA
jgi:triosephosphate isomerase (TIM)